MKRVLLALLAPAVFASMAVGATGESVRAAAPRLTIYSSLPRTGPSGAQGKAIERGAAMALAERRGKLGRYTIAYKHLDQAHTRKNARAAARNGTVVGYIGEFSSLSSKVSIPILNRAGIAQVSPSNTYNGLTVGGPGTTRAEPDKYYPTGRRTYARLQPNDVVQAAALATAARDAGCASAHVFNSRTTYSRGLADIIGSVAPRIGLKISASTPYNPRSRSYRAAAKKIKASCVIQTGELESNGLRLLKDVGSVRKKVRLFGGDGICLNDVAGGLPAGVAKRYRCTIALLSPGAYPARGRKFFAKYRSRYKQRHPDPNAIYGYESMSLLLDSIQAAGPSGTITRAKVVNALFATRSRASVLGTYSIDARGDTTLKDYGVYGISRKRLRFHHVVKARGL